MNTSMNVFRVRARNALWNHGVDTLEKLREVGPEKIREWCKSGRFNIGKVSEKEIFDVMGWNKEPVCPHCGKPISK